MQSEGSLLRALWMSPTVPVTVEGTATSAPALVCKSEHLRSGVAKKDDLSTITLKENAEPSAGISKYRGLCRPGKDGLLIPPLFQSIGILQLFKKALRNSLSNVFTVDLNNVDRNFNNKLLLRCPSW